MAEPKAGDRLIRLTCACGSVLVVDYLASSWRCSTCGERGANTGGAVLQEMVIDGGIPTAAIVVKRVVLRRAEATA